MKALVRESVSDFRRCWKSLFLTGIYYQLIAFILLTPTVSVLFRIFVATSGKSLLADQDILFFFLAPLGWICLITVGALWLGISAVQLAAMFAIVAARTPRGLRPVQALRFAVSQAWPTLELTARVAVRSTLWIAPFLVLAAAAYVTLLSEFDINFYLTKKPPVFFVALGLGAMIVTAMSAALLRLFAGWAFALPIVLFENVSPGTALKLSRERASGQRVKLVFWIVTWLMATILLSAAATSVIVFAVRQLIGFSAGSLQSLIFAIGASLLASTIANLVVGLLSTTSLAALSFNLYRAFGHPGGLDLTPLNLAESTKVDAGFQLTGWRLLGACSVGLVVAISIGIFVIQGVSLEDEVEVIGHRSASKSAPENTMAAVRQAIVDGADRVEIDVQETADGTVVVFHDSDFMKLSGVNLKIWEATLDDLKDMDIGSWFSPEFKDERVPTLGEVLDACKGKVGLYIELKYYGHDVDLERKVAELVEAHDMAEHVAIISLSVNAIEKMKRIRPDWRTGLLMSVSAGNLRKIDADFLAVNASFASPGFIRSANRAGKDVCVWTVNDAVGMSTMIGRGVRGIITDKPALLRSVLEQRAQLSPAERLMLELAGLFGIDPEIGEQ